MFVPTNCFAPSAIPYAAETPIAGLWLAGDYVCADYPATLEGAIRSGVVVAEAILTTLPAR